MGDKYGILLHLKLTHAVGEMIEAMSKAGSITGTHREQVAEVERRTKALADAYNASREWGIEVGKALGIKDDD